MEINGISYAVVAQKQFAAGRTEYTLRRINGKRLYYVVQYENGSFSEVV